MSDPTCGVAHRSFFSGLAVLGVLLTGCGGASHPVVPTAPGAPVDQAVTVSAAQPAGSPAAASVDICHQANGSRSWVPITVSPAALPAHLAHGDARVGEGVPGVPGMQFDSDCVPFSSGPLTIGFSGLSGVANLSPFAGFIESGFTVTPVTGSWVALTLYGQPAPAIVFERSAAQASVSAEVRVSAGGAPFSFTSVDLYSSITPIPYTFVGSLNGTVVFSTSGTVPNTFGNFVTVSNPHSSATIDSLSITLTNPATPCCSNPVGLDNIVLVR